MIVNDILFSCEKYHIDFLLDTRTHYSHDFMGYQYQYVVNFIKCSRD